MKYLVAGFLAPFYWLIVMSVSLWLIRKFKPKWEPILFGSITAAMRRLWRALRAGLRRAS